MTLGCFFYLDESPRFLLSIGKIQEGIKIIDKIGEINNKEYEKINEDEKNRIELWQIDTFDNKIKAKFVDLFKGYNL